jgi:hypothetical protein
MVGGAVVKNTKLEIHMSNQISLYMGFLPGMQEERKSGLAVKAVVDSTTSPPKQYHILSLSPKTFHISYYFIRISPQDKEKELYIYISWHESQTTPRTNTIQYTHHPHTQNTNTGNTTTDR